MAIVALTACGNFSIFFFFSATDVSLRFYLCIASTVDVTGVTLDVRNFALKDALHASDIIFLFSLSLQLMIIDRLLHMRRFTTA